MDAAKTPSITKQIHIKLQSRAACTFCGLLFIYTPNTWQSTFISKRNLLTFSCMPKNNDKANSYRHYNFHSVSHGDQVLHELLVCEIKDRLPELHREVCYTKIGSEYFNELSVLLVCITVVMSANICKARQCCFARGYKFSQTVRPSSSIFKSSIENRTSRIKASFSQ